MRFMMIVKGDENFLASGPPPAALFDAIGKLGEDAFKSGTMVSMGGLKHSREGALVHIRRGALSVTDGPFSESKEVIGGFSIMELPSMEAAIEETRKFMELHRVHWPEWEGMCEVRPMEG